MIKRPRGTRDFTPEEMDRRNYLRKSFTETVESFGYREINLPTFEHLDLFTLRSGPGVIKQMYDFTDKSDRELALRPEFTASAMRFYVNQLQNRPKPLKIYYFGNCFRYERPQKGRYREFWQYGVEFIGSSTELAVAELIALASRMVRNAGVKEFTMRVGYLEILRSLMEKAELSKEAAASAMILIDKKNIEGLEDLLYENGVSPKIISDMVVLIDPDGADDMLERMGAMVKDYPSMEGPYERFTRIIESLKALGVDDFVVDPGIARGLDYYTGMVFEIDIDSLGAEKQICGGGEYSLVPLFGGREVATSGFAMGFDRVLLALENQGYPFKENVLDLYLVPITENEMPYTLELVTGLRDTGFRVDVETRGRSVSKAVKYANAVNAAYVGIVGEDEVKGGTVAMKRMATGKQESVGKKEMAAFLGRSEG